METEHSNVAVFTIADEFALILAANGVRSIFNYFKAITPSQRVDSLHITWLATQVHRHNDFGQCTFALSLFKLTLKCLWAKVVCAGINVDKVNFCTAVQTAIGRRYKGNRGCP
ncbi:hypothetical protein D3C77_455710 [compost metagenome]